VIFDDICTVGFCAVDMTVHSCTIRVDPVDKDGLTFDGIFDTSSLGNINNEQNESSGHGHVHTKHVIEHMEKVSVYMILYTSLQGAVIFGLELLCRFCSYSKTLVLD
jgi:hypothetical protein